jgi:RNA polymerase sigma-70 factor (ECF subfamily)
MRAGFMSTQDQRYQDAAAEFGPAIERLARGYEADPDRRRDLLQEIHFALWRSFALFHERCSLRTWVYRVAHNAAASYVLSRRRVKLEQQVDLEELDRADDAADPEERTGEQQALALLQAMIRQLKPPDAQVMLLYLEDFDAPAIAEVTGLSAGSVTTRIHRVKTILAKRFQEGGRNDN